MRAVTMFLYTLLFAILSLSQARPHVQHVHWFEGERTFGELPDTTEGGRALNALYRTTNDKVNFSYPCDTLVILRPKEIFTLNMPAAEKCSIGLQAPEGYELQLRNNTRVFLGPCDQEHLTIGNEDGSAYIRFCDSFFNIFLHGNKHMSSITYESKSPEHRQAISFLVGVRRIAVPEYPIKDVETSTTEIYFLDDFRVESTKRSKPSNRDEYVKLRDPAYQICPYTCGRSVEDRVLRIAKGHRAAHNEIPYIVRLHFKFLDSRHPGITKLGKCGGSILNSRYILTAAHCIMGENHMYFTYMESEVHVNEISAHENGNVQIIGIENFSIHPKFEQLLLKEHKYGGLGYDVAVVKLVSDIDFSRGASTVCLSPPLSYLNEMATISGYGQASYDGTESTAYLKTGAVRVADYQNHCRAMDHNPGPAPYLKACTYPADADVCGGDSGGPLAIRKNGIWFIIGVITQGRCESPDVPNFATNVSTHMNFIKSSVLSGTCPPELF